MKPSRQNAKRSLAEETRPQDWQQVVGQDEAVEMLQHLIDRSWGGRAYWLVGPSGTGKTTLARLIAYQNAQDWLVPELDASALTLDRLAEIRQTAELLPCRAWIINEAHGLRRGDVLRQLLVFLDDLPAHVAIIFTTTTEGEGLFCDDKVDALPLVSRCNVIRLADRPLEAFAKHAREIAKAEGLNGYPAQAWLDLAERHECNMRGMLGEIETGRLQWAGKRSKPAKKAGKGDCPNCGTKLKHGRKYCGATCYLAHLKSQKRKR